MQLGLLEGYISWFETVNCDSCFFELYDDVYIMRKNYTHNSSLLYETLDA